MAEQLLSAFDPSFSVLTYDNVADALSGVRYPLWGSQPAMTTWINTLHSIMRALAPVACGRIYHDSGDTAAQFSITETRCIYRGELVTIAAATHIALSGGNVMHYVYADPAAGSIVVNTTGWPTTPHVRIATITPVSGAWSWANYVEHRQGMALKALNEPVGGKQEFVTYTTSQTLTSSQAGKCFENTGATALVPLTLPAASAGLFFDFYVADADGIKILAGGTNTIRNFGTVSAAGGYIQSTSIGSHLRLKAVSASQWAVTELIGTWSAPT